MPPRGKPKLRHKMKARPAPKKSARPFYGRPPAGGIAMGLHKNGPKGRKTRTSNTKRPGVAPPANKGFSKGKTRKGYR